MEIITANYIKNNLEEVLRRVEAGEEFFLKADIKEKKDFSIREHLKEFKGALKGQFTFDEVMKWRRREDDSY